MRVILASASPRRKELLAQLGVAFEVIPSNGEEIITKIKPEEVVQELAQQKAKEVADRIQADYKAGKDEWPEGGIRVIGSDTIVVYEEKIFGKPVDEKDALGMLTLLQGNTHQVYTGVFVIDMDQRSYREKTFAEKTDVIMHPVSEKELLEYIATGEPMDKAGSYAIQGLSGKFIKGISGDYYNVVGLPIARLYQECFKSE